MKKYIFKKKIWSQILIGHVKTEILKLIVEETQWSEYFFYVS